MENNNIKTKFQEKTLSVPNGSIPVTWSDAYVAGVPTAKGDRLFLRKCVQISPFGYRATVFDVGSDGQGRGTVVPTSWLQHTEHDYYTAEQKDWLSTVGVDKNINGYIDGQTGVPTPTKVIKIHRNRVPF